MTPPTVIIPSRNAQNLVPCVEAVREHEPDAAIVVIDDGLYFGADSVHSRRWIRSKKPIYFIEGRKPFAFARNINRGIRATGPGFRDVVLLNDDATLESPGGFSLMQAAAAEDENLGLVSATTNVCSSPVQYPAGTGHVRGASRAPGMSIPAVAFVCVLIPGRTIARVGMLDERFTAYGWEDTDYCRRLHDARLWVGIDDRCFVDHSRLTSTFRGSPRAAGDIAEGRRIYLEKWGTL
jgi:GT2 family glycosyltransferase